MKIAARYLSTKLKITLPIFFVQMVKQLKGEGSFCPFLKTLASISNQVMRLATSVG